MQLVRAANKASSISWQLMHDCKSDSLERRASDLDPEAITRINASQELDLFIASRDC